MRSPNRPPLFIRASVPCGGFRGLRGFINRATPPKAAGGGTDRHAKKPRICAAWHGCTDRRAGKGRLRVCSMIGRWRPDPSPESSARPR